MIVSKLAAIFLCANVPEISKHICVFPGTDVSQTTPSIFLLEIKLHARVLNFQGNWWTRLANTYSTTTTCTGILPIKFELEGLRILRKFETFDKCIRFTGNRWIIFLANFSIALALQKKFSIFNLQYNNTINLQQDHYAILSLYFTVISHGKSTGFLCQFTGKVFLQWQKNL